MILGFTGHRQIDDYDRLYKSIVTNLNEIQPTHTISGMAIGADQLFSVICIRLSIPFIAAIPFKDQEKFWPDNIKKQYFKILEKAKEVVMVSEGGFTKNKYQIRNEYIVNNSDIMLAYWNGADSGTGNCIKYTESQNKKYINVY